MSDDRRRSDSELLKHEIVQKTMGQIGTAAKMAFDAFTGGSEAVLDNIAEDFEAKHRGEAGAPLRARYRCDVCRGVHFAGQPCDRLVGATRDTEPAPPPAVVREVPRAPRPLLTTGVTTQTVCVVCSCDAEEIGERSTFGKRNLRCCEQCGQEQAVTAFAYVVPKP